MAENIQDLEKVSKHPPTKYELAGHFADRISAIEQIQRTARQDADAGLLTETSLKIKSLRQQARELNLTRDEFPGLYR